MQDNYFSTAASHLGKSARTYAQLIDAALIVFARDGFEAASINEIAREAGVANGTFYTHFKSKEEISAIAVGKVLAETAKEISRELDTIQDAAERVSTSTRVFARLGHKQMNWGRAYVRAYWAFPEIRKRAQQFMRIDVEQGVSQGRFQVPIDDFLLDALGSLAISAIFPQPDITSPDEVGSKAAELQLRMLGIKLKEAHKIAWRPLDTSEPKQA